jgi:hypothetical protein
MGNFAVLCLKFRFPSPGQVLKYPEMSFSPQGYQWLHKEVETRLREHPEFRSLIGEGF